MTVLMLALGGVLAAAGTRTAALPFLAAAVLGARTAGPLAAASAWTAALAAGFVLLDPWSVRRLGRPALGATAAVAAAWATNGAVVGLLWSMGTVAAVLDVLGDDDRPADQAEGQRWALWLCLLDVPVVGAILSAAPDGFEGWPVTLSTPAAFALLVSALGRIVLAAGPLARSSDVRALLVVRTQVVVLALIAVGLGGRTVANVGLVAGAAAFAAAGVTTDRRLMDVAQELGLYIAALSAAALGWAPRGWAWGALAAGTLIHHLRLMVDAKPAGQLGDLLLRSGGLGLPFLPVVAVMLEGAAVVRGWHSTVVVLGLLAGLALRARSAATPVARRAIRTGPFAMWGGIAVVSLTVVAGLSADVLSLPRPPGGVEAAWPGLWALLAVVAFGMIGAVTSGAVPKRPGTLPPAPVPAWVRAPTLPAGRRLVLGGVATLTAVGAGMWIVGLTRGFL